MGFPTVSMHALFGEGIIEVAEGNLFPFRGCALDAVYIQINALVGGIGATVDIEMPFQKGCISGSHEGRTPINQRLALSGRDEPG